MGPHMIKIDFEFRTEYGLFRDALHLPDNHGLTDKQIQGRIEALKARRRNDLAKLLPDPSTQHIAPVQADRMAPGLEGH